MLKEAFVRGFFRRLARASDDIHRVAKGVESGKITHDLSPEVKKMVEKELDSLKKDVAKQIKSTLTPANILGAGAAAGATFGLGKGIVDYVTGSVPVPSRGPRETYFREGFSNYVRPGGTQQY